MEAARHLSCYCAYLVAAAPELLPDSDAWTMKRYKDVSDDVRAALLAAGGGRESPASRYERLVAALSAESRDRGVAAGRGARSPPGERVRPGRSVGVADSVGLLVRHAALPRAIGEG